MTMPTLSELYGRTMTEREKKARDFTYAVWGRIEKTGHPGWDRRFLGRDVRVIMDAIYDQYLEETNE